ncbi:hypothetical protein W97_07197 [Coniosporium apollinis CBS 100218]|uniref:DUF2293 domain-containing protein n=1 Tax=Coniosporium apollinis (strain CBS 100218) TaxID=1168221 RepID=R7Z1Y4_CONA1|nr:uncharacterized protein W97_07197 [Coniosporium apollinis CBS 100218]EON68049.1 hypothetical protein W97_07197 [Coniosporium apollinis CBS 100218]
MALAIESERTITNSHPVQKGYVFVAKGNVYITRHCRTRTKELGEPLFVVVDSKGHRLGLRCPRQVYDEVLTAERATAVDRQSIVDRKDARDRSEATAALVRLFPRIPPEAAEATVLHAFEKRSRRVGRKMVVSLDDRVTRAVIAHIRHCYTPYEAILRKGVPREQARLRVQGEVSRLLRTWKGLPPASPQTSKVCDANREEQTKRERKLRKRIEKKVRVKRRKHPS